MASSRDDAKKELKAFARQTATEAEFRDMFAELMQEDNDRACAVLCANILDDTLRDGIYLGLRHLNSDEYARLFENDGPLSTFSAKINMAYAMRVIERHDRRNLEIIRDVRNNFAHSLKHMTFQTPEVAAYCRFLKPPQEETVSEGPRSVYVAIALDLASRLRVEAIKRQLRVSRAEKSSSSERDPSRGK